MNRDPIGERGGVNLQSFVVNSPIMELDDRGRAVVRKAPPDGTEPGNGVTGCNHAGDTADVYTYAKEWGECGADCVGQHENVHVEQLKDCCPLYKNVGRNLV